MSKTSKSATSPKKMSKKTAAAAAEALLHKRGPKGWAPEDRLRTAEDGGKFGRKVRRARKECEMSQKDLAEAIGTTQPVISNIEMGTYSAGDEMKAKLCECLGIAVKGANAA